MRETTPSFACVIPDLCFTDVPDPPVNVQLTSCDNRVAQLHWKLISENYSPVTQFVIEYNTSFEPGRWRVARTQLSRERYYQRIALSPWANYSFRVIAQNFIGNSRPSSSTTELCRMPPDVPHHNPKSLCTRNSKPHELIITWQVRGLANDLLMDCFIRVKRVAF